LENIYRAWQEKPAVLVLRNLLIPDPKHQLAVNPNLTQNPAYIDKL
jgi:hypothetical protein